MTRKELVNNLVGTEIYVKENHYLNRWTWLQSLSVFFISKKVCFSYWRIYKDTILYKYRKKSKNKGDN